MKPTLPDHLIGFTTTILLGIAKICIWIAQKLNPQEGD